MSEMYVTRNAWLGKPQLLKSSDWSPMLAIFGGSRMIILFVKDIFFIDVAILKFIIIDSRGSQPFQM